MLFGGDREVRTGAEQLEAAEASSYPPGDLGSSRTVPVSATLASWVRAPKRCHTSSATSFLDSTPCTTPEPSRSTTNAIFPLDRVVTTQPRTVTVAPTWARNSPIWIADMPRSLDREG